MRIAAALLIAVTGCRFHFDELAPIDGAPAVDAEGPPATIALIQSNATFVPSATATTTLSMTDDVIAHDTMIVAWFVNPSTVSVQALTDSLGNTYTTIVGPFVDSGVQLFVAVALDTRAGPDAISVELSASPANEVEVFATEYSNIAGFDAASSRAGTNFGNDQMQSGVVVTMHLGELLYGYGLGPCVAQGTGFELRTTIHGDLTEDALVDPGVHQATATGTCPATGSRWQMVAVAFRAQPVP